MSDVSILFIRVGVVAAMLLALLLICFLSGWRAAPDRKSGETLLRYNPPMRVLGVIMLGLAIGFPLFLIGLVFVVPPTAAWQYPAVAGFALFVALTGLYVYREARESCAIVSDDGILQRSPWFGTKFLAWQDVRKVKSYPNGLKIFYGRDGTTIRFPLYWTGLDVLTEEMNRHLDSGAIEDNPFW
jgi:hypothetical protein